MHSTSLASTTTTALPSRPIPFDPPTAVNASTTGMEEGDGEWAQRGSWRRNQRASTMTTAETDRRNDGHGDLTGTITTTTTATSLPVPGSDGSGVPLTEKWNRSPYDSSESGFPGRCTTMQWQIFFFFLIFFFGFGYGLSPFRVRLRPCWSQPVSLRL